MKACKNNSGVTLVEVLIAVFVLVVGFLGTIIYFTNAIKSTEYAQDLTIATTHAEYIMEEMRSRTDLNSITGENWENWATVNALLEMLPGETITVSYPSGSGADPLDITTTISWERKERISNIALQTQMTK